MPRDRRADLAEFLVARRAALRPSDVGLLPGTRRRIAGLRREEVANLAGVSVSWYTWLEQGRPINPSVDVLDALARALRLDAVERDHLLALCGHPARRAVGPIDAAPPQGLLDLLDALNPSPAYILGPTWNFLAWNNAQQRLSPLLADLPPQRRNLVWLVFAEPTIRELIGDWPSEARRVLSQFRAETTPIRSDPAVVALVAAVAEASPEFAEWWPRHDVGGFEERIRTFHHPVEGTLRFRYEQLIPAGEPDLRLIVHVPIASEPA